MILDETNLFSDDQAVTATADSTDIIKLPKNAAPGNPLPLVIQVTEDFATLTSLTVTVVTDDNSGFSSGTTVANSGAIAVADLVAGYKFPINFVPRGTEEYVKLVYTVAGSNATAGKITAGFVFDDQTNKNTFPTA